MRGPNSILTEIGGWFFASWKRKVAAMLQWKKPNITFKKILKHRFKEWGYYWKHFITSALSKSHSSFQFRLSLKQRWKKYTPDLMYNSVPWCFLQNNMPVVLKVWSRVPWASLRLFQGPHKVRLIFIIILRLFFLFPLSLSHESSSGLSRGHMPYDDIITLEANGMCMHVYSSVWGDFLGKLFGVISNFV